MATNEYAGTSEECCFNYPRDYCRGRGCPCDCHATVADHRLQAYCPPGHGCPMTHPCHVEGCTLLPAAHPGAMSHE